ncbi:exopolysaccharide biosynthesis protein [Candidatus Protochlamydia amoebophila]|uniref:exopolysaccharide biosynthesis protein n=1 Tax=Candidatus Protochlamydia amoebophila TaxID=362787 RepID=UPI001BC9F2B0|nr:exopolysaccharide biosynthesis protein [Candidatus Protochlamydia amoebophila]
MKERINVFAESLQTLLLDAKEKGMTIESLIRNLAKKGQAVLLVLLSLPFCQPIQIPGFSTPFGILLIFIGLRIGFGHQIWLPKWILGKKIPYSVLERIAKLALKVTNKLRYFVYPRLPNLVKNPILLIFHGLMIAILGFVLALPLPIPLSNILAAYPLLIFGLAILEDDGAAILIAYGLSLVCLTILAGLIWLGKEGVSSFFDFYVYR